MRGRGRRPATPKRKAERAIWRITLSAPLSWMLTYVRVRSRVAIRAKLQESRLKERLSVCLRAVAPFPHKACSLCPPPKILSAVTPHCAALRGAPMAGAFLALHPNIALSEWGAFLALHPNIALSAWAFVRASPSTMALIRRRSNENSERALLDTMLSHSEWSRSSMCTRSERA